MGIIRMFLLLIFNLSFLVNNLSEARLHEKKLPSAVVVGAVYCDTCFQQDFSKTSHFISGASVAVECRDGSSRPSFQKEVKTNKHGEFKVHLPLAVSKHVKSIKRCSVKLISSSEPFCAVASSATSSSLHLKSRKQGIHIFSAGFFTFKPLKQPELCNQKPNLATSKEFTSRKTFLPSPGLPLLPPVTQNPTLPGLPTLPPTTQNPTIPNLPPLPLFPGTPLPTLPLPPPLTQLLTLPNLPPLLNFGQPPNEPIQPKTTEASNRIPLSDQKTAHPTFFFPTPPKPFLSSPPPTLGVPLPPNPLQPPPLLTNPFQPPPPSINTPPSFGLTPPPTFPFPFPFPFPQFPVPSSPGIPGIPPASPSKKTSP